MTQAPTLLELMTKPFSPLWQKYEFTVHSNPVGVVAFMDFQVRRGAKTCNP